MRELRFPVSETGELEGQKLSRLSEGTETMNTSITTTYLPSPEQIAYVRGLQKRLHLPNGILDKHCVARFCKPFDALDRRETSQLLDEMIGWKALPADLVRAKGQLDLFRMETER